MCSGGAGWSSVPISVSTVGFEKLESEFLFNVGSISMLGFWFLHNLSCNGEMIPLGGVFAPATCFRAWP